MKIRIERCRLAVASEKVSPNHFPYNVLYSIERDLIVIVAVAHQKRRPTYWRTRIQHIRQRED